MRVTQNAAGFLRNLRPKPDLKSVVVVLEEC